MPKDHGPIEGTPDIHEFFAKSPQNSESSLPAVRRRKSARPTG